MVLPSLDASQQTESTPKVVERLTAELRSMGMPVRYAADVRQLFEERHSRTPAQLTNAEAQTLERCASKAEYHCAGAEYKQTLSVVDSCLAPVKRKLEAYQRDTVMAETVFNVCMFRARAYLDKTQLAEAKAAALECRRMVPDIKPSAVMHPPEVHALIKGVEDNLKRGDTALKVTSTPSGCAVFVNGRRLGSTPFERRGMAPGKMLVQVDCQSDELGRVYPVTLAGRPEQLHIDVGLEEALLSQPTLGLMYLTSSDHARDRLSHALQIGSAVGAQEMFLVSPLDAQDVRVDRVTVDEKRVVASLKLRWNGPEGRFEGDAVGEGLNALLQGRSLDLTGPGAVPMPTWALNQSLSEQTSTQPPMFPMYNAVSWTFGALALAMYGLAWGGAIAFENSSDDSPSHALYMTSGALSSGLLWSAAWMLLPSSDSGPTWWKWGAAAVGAAITVLGIVAPLSPADQRGAYDDMLVFTGTPLVLLPLQDLF